MILQEVLDILQMAANAGFADDKPTMERRKNHAIDSIYCLIKFTDCVEKI